MQLLARLCVTSTSAAKTDTACSAGVGGGSESNSNMPITTASYSPSTASSTSSAAVAAVAASEASSSTSLPSLPSLSATAGSCLTASLLHVTTLLPLSTASASAAVAAAATSHGLVVATPTTVSLHELATLAATSTSEPTTATAGAGAVKCVAHLYGSAAAVTGHQDGRLRLWRLSARTGRLRFAAALPTLSDRLRRFPVPSNHVVVRRHHRRLWIEHADAVSDVAAAADGRLLFSVSWDKTLKVWAIPSLRCLQSLPAHDDAVNAVAVAPDGTVYTGSADRRVRVWASRPACAKTRTPSKKLAYCLVATLSRHMAAVNALAVGCGGQVLYSGGNDRSIVVWEREDSASHMVAVGVLRGHRKAVLCIACVGAEHELVLSGSADRTVRIWRRAMDGREYACVGVMDGHGSAVRSITAAPSQSDVGDDEEYRACSASFDGEVRVWSLRVSGFTRSKLSLF